MSLPSQDYWRGRRVLVTGHTGFKGAWMCAWLDSLGASVTGFALAAEPGANLFRDLGDWQNLNAVIGDVRDRAAVETAVRDADPEVVFHMAAQSLVRRSYRDPEGTFATNVQGTANLLGALDGCADLAASIVVTSDKCYRNDNSGRRFVESDPLGGNDPYSASKAAQETITIGWRRGLLDNREAAPHLVTARAGNVIGGGDWSEDRILPDLFRAIQANGALEVRSPDATRPWQHVLDVLAGYLVFAEQLARGADLPRALNFGPTTTEARPVRWLVDRALATVRDAGIAANDWVDAAAGGPKEAAALALDASLARDTLGWRPRLSQEQAIDWTAHWHAAAMEGKPARELVLGQIGQYCEQNPV